MILLIDTDVLIDVALDRRPHSSVATALLEALERGEATGFLAWHSLANFHYLVQPRHGASATKAFIQELLRFMEVAPTSTDSARYAANLAMRDFEDALQVASAVACRATAIATRNLKEYARAPIRAALPAALLSELSR